MAPDEPVHHANVAGLTLDPSGEDLYIAAGTQEGQIAIYRLPLAHPDAAHLQEFHPSQAAAPSQGGPGEVGAGKPIADISGVSGARVT